VRDSDGLLRPDVTAALGSQAFVISAPQAARTAFAGSVSATARFMKQGYAYVGIDTEVRGGKTEDIGVSAGLRMTF
jgi:hypothetical protein